MGKVTPGKAAKRTWFTVSQAAGFLGISPAGFRSSIMPLLDAEAVCREKPAAVHGPSVVAAVVLRETEAVTRRLEGGSDVTSVALEEMRRWEAKRRELKYRREAAEMVDMTDVETLFTVTAEIMRRAGETIRQEFGDRAQKILDDAWGDVDAQIDRMFADGDSSD